MSTFKSCHLLFDHLQFALIHGPDIPGSYAILLFTASDLASITSHIHSWVLFLFWLHPFILSGVISPLISSSILGTYWPGEFLFQYLNRSPIMGFNLWRPCFHWDWIFLKTTEVKSVIVTKGKGPSGLIFWRLTIGAKDRILFLIGSEHPRALEAIWA